MRCSWYEWYIYVVHFTRYTVQLLWAWMSELSVDLVLYGTCWEYCALCRVRLCQCSVQDDTCWVHSAGEGSVSVVCMCRILHVYWVWADSALWGCVGVVCIIIHVKCELTALCGSVGVVCKMTHVEHCVQNEVRKGCVRVVCRITHVN